MNIKYENVKLGSWTWTINYVRGFLTNFHFLENRTVLPFELPLFVLVGNLLESGSFSRLSEKHARRESAPKFRITKQRYVETLRFFPTPFFFLFFLRGTCRRVARQTRGMPGLIKDGTRLPTPDESFPKAVTLRTKRENENARLESTLFSRSSEQHERDGSELHAKFESTTSRC